MAGDLLAGDFPGSWEFTTLGEVCRRGGGGIQTGPFGSQLHASDYVPIGVPSIMPTNIGDNRIVEDGIVRVAEADAKRLSQHRVQVGDIVYSRRGDVEKRALIRAREEGWLCGTGCLKVRLGVGVVDPAYASYFLGHPAIREWIGRHAIGATMPNLNTSIMSSVPFAFPPLAEQRAIARILGALDDKIELNRKMNETLEAMARALFKSWFVDFDPVRAQAEGRTPTGMDAATAALFPSEFTDSELGPIPRGWSVETIGDVVEVVGGSTPSTKSDEFWASGVHAWATPKDLSSLSSPVLLATERKLTDAGLAQIGSGLLPVGTVLLSSRAPIGYLAIAEIPVAVNQGFIAMKPSSRLPSSFLLRWAATAHDEILSRANGSTFLEISKSNFRAIKLVVPPREIAESFERLAASLYRRVVCNERNSRQLATTRDALLPRLLSGDVEFGERTDEAAASGVDGH